jgi:hypothetical protein
VAGLKSFLKERPNAPRWFAYAILVALFIWSVAFFYLPGQGFTYLIQFGALEHERYLPEVNAVSHFEMPESPGYDSQWYAQIAVHPGLGAKGMKRSVDSLPYRARRILFEWTAWALGGGNPWLVMNIFALQNVVCWFFLAALLLRWFPPTSWGNCFRWGACLYSFGLIFSVRGALLDGPSLLLTVIAMALLGSDRQWAGALVMAISGLGKDTNILCAAALRPAAPRSPKTWLPWLARCTVVVLPLIVWIVCLRFWLGRGDDIGARNFAFPFAGLAHKLEDSLSTILAERYPYRSVAKFDVLVLGGLLAQFLFFLFRMRWKDPWWRLGASYAVLLVFLGDAVWENYPSAAARVLLPMTVAFNVLVPRKGLWPVLLVIGNLGILGSADLLKPPGRESFVVEGPRSLRINPINGKGIEAIYGPKNWWMPEKSRWEYWRWGMGDCRVTLRNPMPFPVEADVTFRLRSVDRRAAIITLAGKPAWKDTLEPAQVRPVALSAVVLPPGDTELLFQSDRPPAYPGNGDHRRLTFSVRDLEILVRGRH